MKVKLKYLIHLQGYIVFRDKTICLFVLHGRTSALPGFLRHLSILFVPSLSAKAIGFRIANCGLDVNETIAQGSPRNLFCLRCPILGIVHKRTVMTGDNGVRNSGFYGKSFYFVPSVSLIIHYFGQSKKEQRTQE